MNHQQMNCSRRGFLSAAPAGAVAAALWGAGVGEGTEKEIGSGDRRGGVWPGFPRQDAGAVREIVGASHFDLDRVKLLVEARPALAKASWDWGFGDWECALGAASHVGRWDIAEVLIAHGARPNLFTLAMMGQVDAVRAVIQAVPGIQRIPGPHGITLLQHARNRLGRKDLSSEDREAVAKTVEYLETLGDADQTATSLELSDADKQRFVGTYRFGEGPDEVFVVEVKQRGELFLRRGDQAARAIHLVESNGFAPAGAPAVRIRFDVAGGKPSVLTVHDPAPLVKAVRVES